MRGRVGLFVVGVVLVGTAAVWAAEAPVTVSPGSATGSLIADACPTFSWGAVPGADGYELVVYRAEDGSEEAKPVLRQRITGSALSWTPSLDSCLVRSSRYAWTVRAVRKEAASDWSAPSLFKVASAVSRAGLEEALQVVRQYLVIQGYAGVEAGTVPETETPSSREALRSSPVPASGATTQLSVDGGVVATSFVGGGSGLTNLEAALATSCSLRRWLDQGDGTVLDCNTRRIWLKDAGCLGVDSWDPIGGSNAFTKAADLNNGTDFGCADYTAGTYDDWRVPAIEELCSAAVQGLDVNGEPVFPVIGVRPFANFTTSLVDTRFGGSPKVSNGTGDGKWTYGDPFVGVLSGFHWSTTDFVVTSAWGADLLSGRVDVSSKSASGGAVWPVRGGQ